MVEPRFQIQSEAPCFSLLQVIEDLGPRLASVSERLAALVEGT